MNDDGFRAYLSARLTPAAVSTYLAMARRIEKVLRIDLRDAAGGGDLKALEQRFKGAADGFTAGCRASCLTALRAYFNFAATQNPAAPATVPDPAPRAPSEKK